VAHPRSKFDRLVLPERLIEAGPLGDIGRHETSRRDNMRRGERSGSSRCTISHKY
jgi:hypothetical protein